MEIDLTKIGFNCETDLVGNYDNFVYVKGRSFLTLEHSKQICSFAQKELAIKVEEILDNFNCEKGDKDNYCKFCDSNMYSGTGGIMHKVDCIIVELREIINN